MKALVINLPKSNHRLNFQTEQLNQLGINFEVLQAVGVTDLESPEHQGKYQKLASTWQRLMRKTEVACFMSHLKAWHHVLNQNEAYLVLEDDAYLSNCVSELLNEFESLTACDLISLENRSRKKIVSKTKQSLGCNSHLLELFQDRTGAAAYVLWPSGAKKLIDKYKIQQKIGLADAFISSSYEIKAFQVEPAPAIQLDQCCHYQLDCPSQTESIITPTTTSHPQAETLIEIISFRLRRLKGQMQIAFRQLSVIHKSERRLITLIPENFIHQKNN